MKTKCYSVRLKSLTPSHSGNAYKAVAFDGSEEWIPIKFIFGQDYGVQKSNAYWIASWILERKNLQYSSKKEAWFDNNTRRILPKITIEKHIPEKQDKSNIHHDESLFK